MPEKATTCTAGVVLSSPFDQPALRHLRVSLDWYDIHVTQAINVLEARQFVAYCYDPAYKPNFDAAHRYCSYFGRDAETGAIVKAYEINRNVAGVETSGVDLQLDWRADAGSGEVSVSWLVGWLGSYDYQAAPEVHGEQWRNTGCCPTLPEWKWNLATQYRIRDLTLGIAWQYFGSVQDYQYRTFNVPSRSYVDLFAAYNFKSGLLYGLSLRAGVTNVLNQDPPILPTYQQANTDPSVYDVLGRRYFVGLNYAIRLKPK